MADSVDLLRFAFAVVGSAELLPKTGPRDANASVPKIGGAGLVSNTGKHAALLASLDLPKRIASKLKIVTLLIDGEAAVTIDENPVVDA